MSIRNPFSREGVHRQGTVMDLSDPVPEDLDTALTRLDQSTIAHLRGARMLVTGGSGFLGSWLVDLLITGNRQLGLGAAITLLTRDPHRVIRRRPDWAVVPELAMVEGDVRTASLPVANFTHVVHAAADTSVGAASQPIGLADTIVMGSRNLLDLSERWGVRRYLFLSSGAVVGDAVASPTGIGEGSCSAPPVDESSAAYGNAKRYAEHLHMLFAASGKTEIVVARGFAFAGPRMPLDAHFAFGNFIRDAVVGASPRLSTGGGALRSYLYAADAAVWILTMLAGGRSGRIYNMGSDEAVSVRELAERISAALGVPAPKVARDNNGAGPRPCYVPDISRARVELGLSPWTSLDEAICRTAYWAQHRHSQVV
jgi:dTDP-glucose 4,6-dehydratase